MTEILSNNDYNIKLKMSMFRQIKNENYTNIYLSEYATICYVALRYIGNNSNRVVNTPQGIWKSLFNNDGNYYNIKGVKDGLEILKKYGLINYEYNHKLYNIDISGLGIDCYDYYFTVNINDIKKIFNQPKFLSLLKTYLLICSTINAIKKYGCTSRERLSEMANVNPHTITNHCKKLSELKLIVFSEKINMVNKYGDFYNQPKIYVKYGNEKYLQDAFNDVNKRFEDNVKEIDKIHKIFHNNQKE